VNRYLTKDSQMVNNMEKCVTSYISGKCKLQKEKKAEIPL
jgi:hypothetical protein